MIGQTLSKYKVTGALAEGGTSVACGTDYTDLGKICRRPHSRKLVQQVEPGA